MTQDIAAPPGLLEISQYLEANSKSERYKKSRPTSISEICFRLLDLRARLKKGDIVEPKAIFQAAKQMDSDLEAWTALRSDSTYETVKVAHSPPGTYFKGTRHIYTNPMAAQAWNSWRTLRILISRIIIQSTSDSVRPADGDRLKTIALMRSLSTDICVSVSNFIGSPRKHIYMATY